VTSATTPGNVIRMEPFTSGFATTSAVAGQLRRAVLWYMVMIAIGSAIWEMLQLPLYTLWSQGTTAGILYALAHCTIGDLMIALAALSVVLGGLRAWRWPSERRVQVAVITILAGVAYTVFSEWLNVEVRKSWAYSAFMPIIPGLGVGLSPVLQWIFVPFLAHVFVWRKFPPSRTAVT